MLFILFVIEFKLSNALTTELSNELAMEFLDLYEGESVLQNLKHQYHKNRNQVYDVWKRIKNKISIERSLKELWK